LVEHEKLKTLHNEIKYKKPKRDDGGDDFYVVVKCDTRCKLPIVTKKNEHESMVV